MSVERVKEALRPFGLDGRVMTFSVSSATVELAALAVGVTPARIAKTLSFLLKDGSCALIVAAGDAKVDNGLFKAFFREKARMLPHERVEELTGWPVGGVCPFALPANARVYLDESLRRFDFIYPAAGSPASAVRLSCNELENATGGTWIHVCREETM